MKSVTAFLVIFLASATQAQDFRSPQSKAAQKKYEVAVAAAREAYLADLSEAAKAALDAGQADEAKAITDEIAFVKDQKKSDEGDPIVLARRKLEGSSWSWTGKSKLSFKKGGIVETSGGQKGRWEMLEPRTCVVKFQDLFVLGFDEKFDEYRAYPYAETTSKLKGGRKIRGGSRN